MSALGLIILLVTAGLVFCSQRRWVAPALFVAVAYVPRVQEFAVGPLNFPVIRLLIIAGLLRVIVKGEGIAGRFNAQDKLMVLWAVWAIGSSAFHESGLSLTRFGEVYTDLGIYFLFRVFLREPEDIRHLFKMVCLVLLPVAAGMVIEKMTGKNFIALCFGESADVVLRHGHFRAKGPYANAILGGTIGGVCLPIAFYLWQQHRKIAMVGIAACGAMVFASGSSGPIMTAMAAVAAVACWRIRDHLRLIRWAAVLLIVALDVVMNDPVYYLVARIDFGGGSTGWYRAAFIQSAIEHLSEWWLVGTDATVHWMPAGTSGVAGQADITNHYIQMGVWGGLLLMVIFVGVLYATFAAVGRRLRVDGDASNGEQMLVWTLGTILFAHAATFWSVSYFDPATVLLFYFVIAAIGSLDSTAAASAPANLGCDPHASLCTSRCVGEALASYE